MNQYVAIAYSLAAGIALGGIYFGGLLLTVRNMHRVKRPGLLFGLSMLGRILASIAVFYLLALGGHWERVLIALFGFLLVRIQYLRKQRPAPGDNSGREENSTG